MKLLLISLLISTTSFAGTIVPDISWNGIVPNQTGSAAALNGRNNASAIVSTIKTTPDEGRDTHSTLSGLAAMKTFNKVATELNLYEFESDGKHSDIFQLNAGYLLNEGLSVGTYIQHTKAGNFENNLIGLSATKKLNKIYIGGGVNQSKSTSGDISPTKIFTGVGFMNEKTTAAEVVLSYQAQEKNKEDGTYYYSNEESELNLNATHSFNAVQIYGNIQYLDSRIKYDTIDTDEEEKTLSLSTGAEYKFNEMFAIGGTLGSSASKLTDNEDSDNDEKSTVGSIGITGRFNFSKFQALVSLSTEVTETEFEDDSDDEEESDQTLGFLGTYFF